MAETMDTSSTVLIREEDKSPSGFAPHWLPNDYPLAALDEKGVFVRYARMIPDRTELIAHLVHTPKFGDRLKPWLETEKSRPMVHTALDECLAELKDVRKAVAASRDQPVAVLEASATPFERLLEIPVAAAAAIKSIVRDALLVVVYRVRFNALLDRGHLNLEPWHLLHVSVADPCLSHSTSTCSHPITVAMRIPGDDNACECFDAPGGRIPSVWIEHVFQTMRAWLLPSNSSMSVLDEVYRRDCFNMHGQLECSTTRSRIPYYNAMFHGFTPAPLLTVEHWVVAGPCVKPNSESKEGSRHCLDACSHPVMVSTSSTFKTMTTSRTKSSLLLFAVFGFETDERRTVALPDCCTLLRQVAQEENLMGWGNPDAPATVDERMERLLAAYDRRGHGKYEWRAGSKSNNTKSQESRKRPRRSF